MVDEKKVLSENTTKELREMLLNDRRFQNDLLWELLERVTKAGAWVVALLLVVVSVLGYTSFGSLARATMMDYLESEGEIYKQQFQRLSKMPSYTTFSAEITVNDSTKNFVELPLYSDTKQRAELEECAWFVTPIQFIGQEIHITIAADTVDGVEGLRVTSLNKRETGATYLSSAGPDLRDEYTHYSARVFIFASRSLP